MAQDHEGNTLQVGDNLWVPAVVTAVFSNGTVNVKTAYSNTQIVTPFAGTEGHKPSNFPDRP
jgi:hypothetical protein